MTSSPGMLAKCRRRRLLEDCKQLPHNTLLTSAVVQLTHRMRLNGIYGSFTHTGILWNLLHSNQWLKQPNSNAHFMDLVIIGGRNSTLRIWDWAAAGSWKATFLNIKSILLPLSEHAFFVNYPSRLLLSIHPGKCQLQLIVLYLIKLEVNSPAIYKWSSRWTKK